MAGSLEHDPAKGKPLLREKLREPGVSPNSGQRLEVTVDGDEGSPRLDRVLATRVAELSRSRLKALILAGSVCLPSAYPRDGIWRNLHKLLK